MILYLYVIQSKTNNPCSRTIFIALIISRLELDLEDVKCADNSTGEVQGKSKENSAGEVEEILTTEGEEEISLETKDALGISDEPNYPSFTDAYS